MFPVRITTFAVFIIGLIPSLIICMHWDAQSPLWSYWPGKYSIANTLSSLLNSTYSLYTSSVLGSENTVFIAFSYTSSSIFSMSYLFKILKFSIVSIFKLSSKSDFRCLASKSNPCFFSTSILLTEDAKLVIDIIVFTPIKWIGLVSHYISNSFL